MRLRGKYSNLDYLIQGQPGPNRSQGMATPPAATTPPYVPNAQPCCGAQAGPWASAAFSRERTSPLRDLRFSRLRKLSITLVGLARGFAWGLTGLTPSVSASAPALYA